MKYSGIVEQKPNNVNNFWLLSRDAVIESGMLEKNTEWYVKLGQIFHFDGFCISGFR